MLRKLRTRKKKQQKFQRKICLFILQWNANDEGVWIVSYHKSNNLPKQTFYRHLFASKKSKGKREFDEMRADACGMVAFEWQVLSIITRLTSIYQAKMKMRLGWKAIVIAIVLRNPLTNSNRCDKCFVFFFLVFPFIWIKIPKGKMSPVLMSCWDWRENERHPKIEIGMRRWKQEKWIKLYSSYLSTRHFLTFSIHFHDVRVFYLKKKILISASNNMPHPYI